MQKLTAVFCLLSLVCFASAELSISPSNIDFGNVQIGESVERIVYIINVGDEPVVMSGIGGGVSGAFESTQNCQGDTISPGHACQMYFTFNSATEGSLGAVSEGSWNGQSFQITLSATAVRPQLSIAPSSLDFGTVEVGKSKEKFVYITNTGVAPLVMDGAGGGLEAPFLAVQNCVGETLNPGQSCEMFFTFTPNTTGSVVDYSIGEWNGQYFNITLTANAADEIEA